MSLGTITVGRLVLTEAQEKSLSEGSGDDRSITISGQESYPSASATSLTELVAIHDDLVELEGRFVPVVFTDKSDRSGYYVVSNATADLVNWGGEVVTCDWQMSLSRVGSESEVDVEARVSGPTTRETDFEVAGSLWHSPPIGHSSYWSSSTQPSVLTRTGEDGAQIVYLGVPEGVNPRYACALDDYPGGRVRFVDDNGIERSGVNFPCPTEGWSLSNGLVKVEPLTSVPAVISVSTWDTGAADWVSKGWDIRANGVSFGNLSSATVLRNDYEAGIVRLTWDLSPGRAQVDLMIRRGSRLVELYVQRSFSSTLSIRRQATEAGTSGTGYVRATSNDANGNRYIVGSAHTFTADTTNGGLSVSATTTLGAFIGYIYDGSGAVVGDTGDDLFKQYLGARSESSWGVRR